MLVRVLKLGTIFAAAMQIRDVKDANRPPHRVILHRQHTRAASVSMFCARWQSGMEFVGERVHLDAASFATRSTWCRASFSSPGWPLRIKRAQRYASPAIEVGKTKRSRRTLEVPALLRPYLLALAKDRAPEAQLITRGASNRGNKHGRHWLLRHLRALCKEVNVPVVCPHSLRGLHATLATEAGVTSHAVAAALGHLSPAVTHAHYIEGGARRRAHSKRVLDKLAPEGTGTLALVGNG